jgi:crotonyl-CoA carboxylase/reductase
MAIQLVARRGGRVVAVVSSEEKAEHRRLGACGVIDRREFDHWGRPPVVDDATAFRTWQRGSNRFRQAWWQALGERRDPWIVLEHPGEDTMATWVTLWDRGGMVVTCGATSGYLSRSLMASSAWPDGSARPGPDEGEGPASSMGGAAP